MSSWSLEIDERIATLALGRGKVNALNEETVEELAKHLPILAADAGVRGVILTGRGSFFSFGFDIPEFHSYSRQDFTRFLEKFTGLYTALFVFPKPVVAALNGHTIAGGCMLALACDRRLMVEGRAKISLNEITFGASIFAGSASMLTSLVGRKSAETVLFSGAMLDAGHAQQLGLIDQVTDPDDLASSARAVCTSLAAADPVAFRSLKRLVRGPIAERMKAREAESIREFVDIWYSDDTRRRLEEIRIRS
ncbi:MAG: enoyl-CoA hydratase/isomerase family protein [bacterium]|nr:enoyl-CoA hydratase/isomerase family protein [bacterium]